jgi:hypothetical protein
MGEHVAGQSPAPGTPQTNTKAYVSGAVSGVIIVVSSWIADSPPATAKEWAAWIVAGVIGSGLTGAVTYKVPNRAK